MDISVVGPSLQAEIISMGERVKELEAALRKINALIDSPARFNADVQAVLDSVIDTSDVDYSKIQL